MKIRYATDATNSTKSLYVNGEKVQTLRFPTTGGMSSYSDGSTRNMKVSADNITRFKSIAEEMGQTVTYTVGGKSIFIISTVYLTRSCSNSCEMDFLFSKIECNVLFILRS
ncbi:hypothetical protein CN931_14300 [Bacillus sp. AFS054943]|uniref:Uncharacterized protein n=1 Tax=Bacillus cereus TaxID=1396 RepID=A0A2A8ITG0_BACCE|nr:hypothetical protein CN476_19885 [Bacillus cereus]PFA62650.1 hypothetical protein CN402_07745 [Bacillus sp. AFS015896]PGL82719.1 hypothetical protein CN931_14300 [Bacillus sp. AFS054943]PGX11724.1 hypothetical protein COE07_12135 [Bacillus sp. AFS033286]PGZ75648.1 hypothetical protein COE49_04860 [Bacillus sp. AFS029637]